MFRERISGYTFRSRPDQAPNQDDANINEILSALDEESILHDKQIIRAIYDLTKQLKDKLPNFDTVISDETSARALSLYFYNLINGIRAEHKDKYPHKAKVFFVTGGRDVSEHEEKAVNKFIAKCNRQERVLFVTEYVHTGGSLKRMVNIFKKNGIDFESAILSVLYKNSVKKLLDDAKATVGSEGEVGDLLSLQQAQEAALGVENEVVKSSNMSAHPVLQGFDFKSDAIDSRENVNYLRKDIKILAKKMQEILF